jgi:hypothetical protein
VPLIVVVVWAEASMHETASSKSSAAIAPLHRLEQLRRTEQSEQPKRNKSVMAMVFLFPICIF